MGAELICHFPIGAKPITGATARAVSSREGGTRSRRRPTLLPANAAGQAMITARVSPRSTAQTGRPLRVVVDAERMHFFDPETEASIW